MGFRHFICKNEEYLAEGLIEKLIVVSYGFSKVLMEVMIFQVS